MYLLDTDTCLDFMQGTLPCGYHLLQASDPKMFAVPAIVEAELRAGALASAHPNANRQLLERFLDPFDIVPFCSRCAYEYARVRFETEREGFAISTANAMIAATARAHGAVLVTGNEAAFEHVSGLSLESWGETEL